MFTVSLPNRKTTLQPLGLQKDHDTPLTPLGKKPKPNHGSDNLWNILFLYGGQRDLPLFGSGLSGPLSGSYCFF